MDVKRAKLTPIAIALLGCGFAAVAGPPEGYSQDADYPLDALRNNEQGTVHFSVVVGTDGRVKSCQVEVSSGSASLDKETCKIMMTRARFKPATNAEGKPVEDVTKSKMRWVLPK